MQLSATTTASGRKVNKTTKATGAQPRRRTVVEAFAMLGQGRKREMLRTLVRRVVRAPAIVHP
jgi:hypothetical protein